MSRKSPAKRLGHGASPARGARFPALLAAQQNSFVSIWLADSYPIASISHFPALQVFMENAGGNKGQQPGDEPNA